VQDHIEANIALPFTLEDLAGVSGFSKFHFHRIFSGLTGESLLHNVNRVKLERAAAALAHRPDLSVTDIAYQYGFTDSAVFSRAFRNYYQMSPSMYRGEYRKNRKAPAPAGTYNGNQSTTERTGTVTGDVELVTMDALRVVYTRYTGTYAGLPAAYPGMMQALFEFAGRHHLLVPGQSRMLSIFHDNPEFTGDDRLRTSLCLTIPDGAAVPEDGGIGCMLIPAGDYAVGHFNIRRSEYGGAWDFMYAEWLTNSRFQPGDSSPFELYLSPPADGPGGKQQVDIYLPVEPLNRI
jgi:AraC family transcriptional regulator